MKTGALLLAAVALLGACTPAPRPSISPVVDAAAEPPVSAVGEPPDGLLVLADLRVLQRGEPYLTLYRNGLLTQAGDVLGTLHSSGVFVALDGDRSLVLKADGTVPIPEATLVLSPEGTATLQMPGVPPQKLSFDAEGRLVGDGPETRVEGMAPDTRRTAMFVILLPDLLRFRRHRRIE
ncbi:hypothetical protein [Polyangium sp. 6x1]|uniref:hypothetical protein n=1 Tax=Polyangium sp. 6x1 TaxID=3042689 RepID=UPI002482ED96|nr:hypothetical protein [Polyangium sp. 6x1]MDI1447342.1 hypothetical protein [Polyangium sp. 6x1]